MRALDLTGRRFGHLVAKRPMPERDRGCIVWRCVCDCGNKQYLASAGVLTAGKKKSCGCQVRNRPGELEGQRFGRLIVSKSIGHSSWGDVVWRCICDCGRAKEAMTRSLRAGFVKSCGCLSADLLAERNRLRKCAAYGPEEKRAANRAANRAYSKRVSKRVYAELPANRIAAMLGRSVFDVPKNLIDLKREHLRLVRLLKEKRA